MFKLLSRLLSPILIMLATVACEMQKPADESENGPAVLVTKPTPSRGDAAQRAYVQSLLDSIDHMDSGKSTIDTRLYRSERKCELAQQVVTAYKQDGAEDKAREAISTVDSACGRELERQRQAAALMKQARGY